MKKDSLTTDQQNKLQQVLGYAFDLDSPDEHQATDALISQDREAQQLHQSLAQTLAP